MSSKKYLWLFILSTFILTSFTIKLRAESQKTFEVVHPTIIAGNQKTYSLEFSASPENAPFKLFIKNGSGSNYSAQTCTGNLIVKLLCVLKNTITTARAVLKATTNLAMPSILYHQ